MELTYGFYNSVNGDRSYNATQMSELFDGIIKDGVFTDVGECFAVVPNYGMTVNVGSGRAWFNNTWTKNEISQPIDIPSSNTALNRIDAIVLEVNSDKSVRENFIKVISGEYAVEPEKPSLLNTETVHQHAIAYIRVDANVTVIESSMIENAVGTEETPYVVSDPSIEGVAEHWQARYESWFESVKGEMLADDGAAIHADLDAMKYIQAELLSSSWAVDSEGSYVQSIVVNGLTENWQPGVPYLVSTGSKSDDIEAQTALAYISRIKSDENLLSFVCYSGKPVVDITIRVPGNLKLERDINGPINY